MQIEIDNMFLVVYSTKIFRNKCVENLLATSCLFCREFEIATQFWIANGVITFQNGHRQAKSRNGESSFGEISVWSVLKVLVGKVFRDAVNLNPRIILHRDCDIQTSSRAQICFRG